jgi:acetone carboxylase gamma subunit
MTVVPIGDALEAVIDAAGGVVRCARCSHVYGHLESNYKLHARFERSAVTAIPGVGDPARYELDVEMEFRRYYCPDCGVQIETELAKPGEPIRWDVQLRASSDGGAS